MTGHKSDTRPAISGEAFTRFADKIAEAPGSPALKRKALLAKGIRTEYQPHQGAREIARRLKRMSKSQQVP